MCKRPKLSSSGPISLLAAYIEVTAVITKRTTILGFDISRISFRPNVLCRLGIEFIPI